MYCSQCQGIEEIFSQDYVAREIKRYRKNGPGKTTRMLTEAIESEGVAGQSLLDIGGGLGAVQHALLEAGMAEATSVEASPAYFQAAREEAVRRGFSVKVTAHLGNYVDLVDAIQPADIVTLDRVICCFPDMEALVKLSASRARRFYGLVYPRDRWWLKAALEIGNFFLRLQRSQYRAYVHPTRAVESLLKDLGLVRRSYHQTLAWQVAIFSRMPG